MFHTIIINKIMRENVKEALKQFQYNRNKEMKKTSYYDCNVEYLPRI